MPRYTKIKLCPDHFFMMTKIVITHLSPLLVHQQHRVDWINSWGSKGSYSTLLTILPAKLHHQHHHYRADWINNFESTPWDQKRASLLTPGMEKISRSTVLIWIIIVCPNLNHHFQYKYLSSEKSSKLNQFTIYIAIYLNLFQTSSQF